MRMLKYFFIVLLIGIIVFYYASYKSSSKIIYNGETMGTYYAIKINSSSENNILHGKIKEVLKDINAQMSVFDANSEVSKINNAEAGVWVELSDDMAFLLKNAYDVYKKSGGAFDPTVGKLVDLWGFGTSKSEKTPSDKEIKEVLSYTGFDKLEFSNDFRKLRKKHSSTYLNLSALAKGYGVDKIAELLDAEGYSDYVVEIGGEVRAKGKRNDETDGWNIGVTNPQTGENAYVITMKDYTVATSGDYRNYYYMGAKRVSHTISPKTGYPAENLLASVSVFDKNCMIADAEATAIMSMGEKKALQYANDNDIAVIMFIRKTDGSLDVVVSKKAEKLINK